MQRKRGKQLDALPSRSDQLAGMLNQKTHDYGNTRGWGFVGKSSEQFDKTSIPYIAGQHPLAVSTSKEKRGSRLGRSRPGRINSDYGK